MLPGVNCLGGWATVPAKLFGATYRDNLVALDRQRFRPRLFRVHGINPRVGNQEVGGRVLRQDVQYAESDKGKHEERPANPVLTCVRHRCPLASGRRVRTSVEY